MPLALVSGSERAKARSGSPAPSTPGADLAVLPRLGPYRTERELGRGAFATVYLAIDQRHGRNVALKVLEADSPHRARVRFLHEIEMMASLRHPHILPLYDSGEQAGLLFYVMPFIPGGTLAQRLREEGRLPLPDAIRWTREVAEALAFVHHSGYLHLDIKPENILMDSGHAVLADFGIAQKLDTDGCVSLAGQPVGGTPAYTSPEQAVGSAVDERADVYSLACLLFELLTGELPFTGPTASAICARRLVGPVPSVRDLRASAPPSVDALLIRALAPNADDRTASVGDFAHCLARAVTESRRRWWERSIGWAAC